MTEKEPRDLILALQGGDGGGEILRTKIRLSGSVLGSPWAEPFAVALPPFDLRWVGHSFGNH